MSGTAFTNRQFGDVILKLMQVTPDVLEHADPKTLVRRLEKGNFRLGNLLRGVVRELLDTQTGDYLRFVGDFQVAPISTTREVFFPRDYLRSIKKVSNFAVELSDSFQRLVLDVAQNESVDSPTWFKRFRLDQVVPSSVIVSHLPHTCGIRLWHLVAILKDHSVWIEEASANVFFWKDVLITVKKSSGLLWLTANPREENPWVGGSYIFARW